MIPVIMAGGSGTRLWPLSRTAFPKQFLALNSHLTMLQQTAARLDGIATEQPLVICNEEHRFLVAEQMRQKGYKASILLEPVGRNTAPAIALEAGSIAATDAETMADVSRVFISDVLLPFEERSAASATPH